MKKLLGTFLTLSVVVPFFALGASLQFAPSTESVGRGGNITVDLFFDPEGESFNAIEAQVHFPYNIIRGETISTGKSIISLWIEQPNFSNNSQGSVSLSGIIPGGFEGIIDQNGELQAGNIATFSFLAAHEGVGNIEVSSARAIKNDGKGTVAILAPSRVALNIEGTSASSSSLFFADDNTPPEPFVPQIVRFVGGGDSDYALVFHTTDKGSGLDHYEVKIDGGEFRKEKSPYILSSDRSGSIIMVKAVDVAGNERIESVRVPFFYTTLHLFAIAIIGVIVLSLLLWGAKKFFKY